MFKIKRGFTLIELLVVISIIGILATLLIANYNAARSRARDAQRKSDLRNIQTALRLYYNDVQRYPCDVPSGADIWKIKACDPDNAACSAVGICSWGSIWQVSNRLYMSTLPEDPSPDRSYRYDQVSNETYTLKACLENPSDDKCGPAEAWCDTSLGGCVYTVQP
jgi:prepilin-type N-terminal cleavage/methylation domain-containing protein